MVSKEDRHYEWFVRLALTDRSKDKEELGTKAEVGSEIESKGNDRTDGSESRP